MVGNVNLIFIIILSIFLKSIIYFPLVFSLFLLKIEIAELNLIDNNNLKYKVHYNYPVCDK